MSILNPLPELLSFAFIAPLLLRITIGAYFLEQLSVIIHTKYISKKNIKIKNIFKYLIGIKTLSAMAIITGFYTQIAVLILITTTIIDIILEKRESKLKKTKFQLYIFIFVILLSLLITGAGFFAMDMPL